MHPSIRFALALPLLTLLAGAEPVDNPELQALFEADQAARFDEDADWDVVAREDSLRLGRVEQLRQADSLFTANDCFHAAMVFQHGMDSSAYRRAWELAGRAVELDSSHDVARWLTAATEDRWRLSLGQPQRWGTQFLILDDVWYLDRIDTLAVSDEQRLATGTRTLAEIVAYLTEQNGEERGLNVLPDSLKSHFGR